MCFRFETLKALVLCGNNPFRVETIVVMLTQGCRVPLQPWAQIGQRLRRSLWWSSQRFGV